MARCLLTRASIREAESHLANADAVMARLISDNGSCSLHLRRSDPFHALSCSIISQQLSAQAAATIKGRVALLAGDPLAPRAIMAVKDAKLREAGLSFAKIRYIKELAETVSRGALDFDALHGADDAAVLKTLTSVKGVGQWTAEMFMIFSLKRPDIVSLGDAGLQRAARQLYTARGLTPTLARRWSPYGSVASWHLWRHLDQPRSKNTATILPVKKGSKKA
ncbi:MAG: DNA-3-methyladenine glycosylase 2 family protein [Alphaproteobacteria bacterium]|nr:DNA-3-methyladenine glycosylase 2 family protein [Alphaproteobacteria bacterium]MBV8548073.1 DNA-3-methyladenine glycosylase 2 family protein [Alphaproteobacteria bacterium]